MWRPSTQSQEAELRLEMSFQTERLLDQLIELRYGRQFGGVLLMLARAMDRAGRGAVFSATRSYDAIEHWLTNPYAFDQAEQAAQIIFDGVRPNGDPSFPGRAGFSSEDYLGVDAAVSVLMATKDPDDLHRGVDEAARNYELQDFGRKVNQLLGAKVIEQMRVPELRAQRGKAIERARHAR